MALGLDHDHDAKPVGSPLATDQGGGRPPQVTVAFLDICVGRTQFTRSHYLKSSIGPMRRHSRWLYVPVLARRKGLALPGHQGRDKPVGDRAVGLSGP